MVTNRSSSKNVQVNVGILSQNKIIIKNIIIICAHAADNDIGVAIAITLPQHERH
jgi:hypothetical protein